MNDKQYSFLGRYSLLKHGTFDEMGSYKTTSLYHSGEINYSADGTLSVLILFNEDVKSSNDILSYVGTFEVESQDTLVHNISLCSQQTRNGNSEKRTFSLIGEKLTLGCDLLNNSRFEAEWIRINM